MQQTEVTLHGHRMVYRVAGDPNLPVLLMIHGITSSSATWDPVIPALAEHAHVIAPDLLGHGESDKPRTCWNTSATIGSPSSGTPSAAAWLCNSPISTASTASG